MISLDRPVFIVGLHRTGSTLFKNALDRNSSLAMASDEMQLEGPWRRGFVTKLSRIRDAGSERGLERVMNLVWSAQLPGTFWTDLRRSSIDRDALKIRIRESDRSARNVVAILLDAYRRERNRPRVGAKYPLHISRVGQLQRWFPDCKILHLTRDPRAILSSKLRDEATRRRKTKGFGIGAVVHHATTAVFLADYAWSGRVHRRLNGSPGYRLIRYEDLVAHPREVLASVCSFAGLEFQEEMLDTVGKPSSHSGLQPQGFDGSNLTRWKTRLGRFDRHWIAAWTTRSRRSLGYGGLAEGSEETRCQHSY